MKIFSMILFEWTKRKIPLKIISKKKNTEFFSLQKVKVAILEDFFNWL